MMHAEIGHNSARALAEENARLRAQKVEDDQTIVRVTQRAERAETAAQKATVELKAAKAENKLLASRNALVEARLRRINTINSEEGLSTITKSVATHVITAAHDDAGEARVRTDSLLRWVSISKRSAVSDAIRELEKLRLFEVSAKAIGSRREMVFRLLPEAELQGAVEAYRAERSAIEADRKPEVLADTLGVSQTLGDTYGVSQQPVADTYGVSQPLADTQGVSQPVADTYGVSQKAAKSDYQRTDSRHTPYIEDSSNKNWDSNPSHTPESAAAREDVCGGDALRALGLVADLKTIRHRNFTISLDAIEMRTLGKANRPEVRAAALAFAMQWAAEIQSGKHPKEAVPQSIVGFIAASLRNGHVADQVASVRIEKAGKSPSHVPYGNNRGSTYSRNWRDA